MLDQLAQLKSSWPGTEWTWDSRFSTVGSSFTLALEPQARASAKHALTREWTVNTLADAPEGLRALAARSGGLRAGQKLLAGDDDPLFGLWWPWGNGQTITLRIGCFDDDANTMVRALFGVG